MEKQGTSDLKDMSVLPLSHPILIESTKASSLMEDAMLREVRRKSMKHIFSTIIGTKNFELSVKLGFN